MKNSDSKTKTKNKTKIYEVVIENDIRYRGPLSYRHFKILGWLCIALSQVVMLSNIASQFAPDAMSRFGFLFNALSVVSSLAIPFMLIANYSQILDFSDGFKMQLLFNGIATGTIIIFFLVFFYRYIIDALAVFVGSREDAFNMMHEMLYGSGGSGFVSFNIFIDLLLCTLLFFFLTYRPKRVFTGKKIYIFRAFAVIPVLYELLSIFLKALSVYGVVRLPFAVMPFLTTKPPVMFLVFIVLAFFIKNRELRFLKNGRTHEEYKIFLGTNRNSWQFSKFTAIILALAAIVDILLLILFVALQMHHPDLSELEESARVASIMQKGLSIGLGNAVVLAPMAPIMLLYSYTRSYKKMIVDILIPVFGVFLIIIVYLESAHFALGFLKPVQ